MTYVLGAANLAALLFVVYQLAERWWQRRMLRLAVLRLFPRPASFAPPAVPTALNLPPFGDWVVGPGAGQTGNDSPRPD